MDWSNRNWSKEDKLYAPKRKVDNKGSHNKPHVIGSIASYKMSRDVAYHSLAECLFYYFLELDQASVRYYDQPINVHKAMVSCSRCTRISSRLSSHLYQIKNSPDMETEIFKLCNSRCEKLAFSQNWKYSVIYPKTLPEVVVRNLKFLNPYLKKRKSYSQWVDQVINNLSYLETSSVLDIARSFTASVDFRYILPVVYHLIATGVFNVNLQKTITLGNFSGQLRQFLGESDSFETVQFTGPEYEEEGLIDQKVDHDDSLKPQNWI
ncbi:hypothetical protein AB432_001745 [Brevibacillus brevis]|uniref:Uncharacterized protein n=1 Tax=Brevibacillus brevis TaxID=1393 RepID=A0A2Z4MBK5_BREBE|nr:TnsA endonuclease C-terminal domain-containing protein [Brevibacillus brevis]AWX53866.1 hypothetical protein AB432_001745 [Brevibacillus brevis]